MILTTRARFQSYVVPADGRFRIFIPAGKLEMRNEVTVDRAVAEVLFEVLLLTGGATVQLLEKGLRLDEDDTPNTPIQIVNLGSSGGATQDPDPIAYEEVDPGQDGGRYQRVLRLTPQEHYAQLTGGSLTIQPGDTVDLLYQARALAISPRGSTSFALFNDPVTAPTAVPLPASWALLATGFGALAGVGRRRT